VAGWPINADELPVFDYNDSVRDTGESTFEAEPTGNDLYDPGPARTSDHDPVLVDLNLCPERAGAARNLCLAKNLLLKFA
jgi:predicted extracellular nuclease